VQPQARSFILIPALALLNSNIACAESGPRWEFGLGVGGLSIPHYRGSDQRQDYVAPVPYVRYEGKRLQVDREGGRLYLYKSAKFWLDLSASIDFPVDSNDNRARQDMPDLKPVFEIGPRAQFDLYANQDQTLRLRIAFPLRMAIATDIHQTRNIGLVFSPYLQLRYYSGWETALSLGPIIASESYHDYYYQVDPQYATTERPAYDAKAGYSGFRFTLTTSRRLNQRYWLGAFLRYDMLNGAVFADSPLVKQNDSLMAGLAFAYLFTTSIN
jgi:outer membrane protein